MTLTVNKENYVANPIKESLENYVARETQNLMSRKLQSNPYHSAPRWSTAATVSTSDHAYISLHTASPQKKENPVKTNVQEVRVKAGWVGQVVLGAEFAEPDIVWESVPKKKRHKARELAVAHLAEVFA